jgi:Rieske Fe-S protein
MEPADGAGFVGRTPGSTASTYLITGDSGNGLTLGTLGAHVVADLIDGRRNAWAEVFDPSRSMFHAASDFVRENANVAAQYLDLVRGGDVDSANDVAFGQGAIIREGTKLLAVYRDDEGDLHTCSALCPHLEGVVHWNAVEKSWDCPCHGSRFDRYGRVIFGPATSNLSPAGKKSEPVSDTHARPSASDDQAGRRGAYAQQPGSQGAPGGGRREGS